MRTAQRWERGGLPVSRPFPGRRSHVVADSELLEAWVRDSVFWRKQDFEGLRHVQRTSELRAEARREREILHERIKVLRQEVAAVRATTEQLQREHGNARARRQAAGN